MPSLGSGAGYRSEPRRRHGRRLRTWQVARGIFPTLRSFHLADGSTVARILLSAVALIAFTLVIVLPLALFSAFAFFTRDVPPVEQVMNRPVFQTTRIYDRNNVLLAELIDPDHGR